MRSADLGILCIPDGAVDPGFLLLDHLENRLGSLPPCSEGSPQLPGFPGAQADAIELHHDRLCIALTEALEGVTGNFPFSLSSSSHGGSSTHISSWSQKN